MFSSLSPNLQKKRNNYEQHSYKRFSELYNDLLNLVARPQDNSDMSKELQQLVVKHAGNIKSCNWSEKNESTETREFCKM